MYYAGIDLGGTHMAAGVTDASGTLLSRSERPTLAGRPADEILRDLAACAEDAVRKAGLRRSDIASLGIGVPGFADPEKGTVFGCNNLGWEEDLPLREKMTAYTSLPVCIANDADCAALAESRSGAAAGADSCILITLGTGIGGGMILHGKPWSGAHRVAGEIGHAVLVPGGLPCNCGRHGCVERYCSATALAESAWRNAGAFPPSPVFRGPDGLPAAPDAERIIRAAREGDPLACQVFGDFVRSLARTLDNIIVFLDPEVVLLGGGISHAGSFLLDAVTALIPTVQMGAPRPLPKIALAKLGNEAGIIGAALLGA